MKEESKYVKNITQHCAIIQKYCTLGWCESITNPKSTNNNNSDTFITEQCKHVHETG